MDNRLFIAEPPLYRVDDKKNPFVINKEDYVTRYAAAVVKDYRIGYKVKDELEFMSRSSLLKFLTDTSDYVDDLVILAQHYKVNDRLLEIIIEEISYNPNSASLSSKEIIEMINLDNLMDRVCREFPELYYDDKDSVIKGVIDGKYQLFEISERFVRKASPLVQLVHEYGNTNSEPLIMKHNTTGSEQELSLLGILKILKKFQPTIVHRFKGLGENSKEDMRTTIMDPNTRTLIRVQTSDIENDMAVFQMLRGDSNTDRMARKRMMAEFEFDVSLIDT